MYIGRYARTYLQPHYRPFGKKLFLHTSWDSWWMEGTPIMFCIGSLDYKITIYQVTAPTSKTMQQSKICIKYRKKGSTGHHVLFERLQIFKIRTVPKPRTFSFLRARLLKAEKNYPFIRASPCIRDLYRVLDTNLWKPWSFSLKVCTL